MTYLDSITLATSHVLDWDLPDELLPLSISNEAEILARMESDHLGGAAWN